MNTMAKHSSAYFPISCEIHDLLEICALTRRPTQIRLRDGAGEGAGQLRSVVITDVYSLGGAEYLCLNTGETLRLDQLVDVDGTRLGND